MSDRIRTALEGSGTISIKIEVTNGNDVRMWVTESWARQTSVQQSEVKAHILDALDDPDAFIEGEVAALFNKHMNWKAAAPAEPALPASPEPPAGGGPAGDPGQDIIDGMLSFGEYKPRPLPPVSVRRIEPKPVLSPARELVEKVRAGLRVSLLPLESMPGRPGGVQISMECIDPMYAAGRMMNRFLTTEKLSGASDPEKLVGQALYELSERIYGPVLGGKAL